MRNVGQASNHPMPNSKSGHILPQNKDQKSKTVAYASSNNIGV